MAALEQGAALGLQHGLARQAGDPLTELQPPRDHVALDDLAHDPHPLRLLRLHQLAGEAELLGDGRREHGARRRVARRDASRQLGIAEDRRGRGDPQVAEQRQREPAGDRRAVDRGDDRAPAAADRLEGDRARLDQLLAVLQVAAELRRVHPGAECGAGARQHDAAHLVVAGEAAEGVGELQPQLDRERVSLLGAAQRDERDLLVTLDRQQPGHGGMLSTRARVARAARAALPGASPPDTLRP